MPGVSFRGESSPLNSREEKISEVLEQDLIVLSQDIGERNVSQRYAQLMEAAAFIERSLQEAGYEIRRQEFMVDEHTVWNIDVECTGCRHPDETVVVGAHYDTVPGSPGANDNGSAVVANLALARSFADVAPERTIRFAFFVNEEFPYYMTDAMGSLRYAQHCRATGEMVIGMICLETIGCYLDEPHTQRYPVALLRYLYPTTGNFMAVVGNVRSRRFVHRVIRGLRRTKFPSEGMAAPRWMKDIFRSDHAAFWCCGYPALMITDTANFRYRHYHTAEDTPDKVNYAGLARVVTALGESLVDLAGASPLTSVTTKDS
ncbi:MAG: M20/M25/M40 family metallo-hydrolase [Pirellulaceae bacterium]|jgi:Zn-dependent M28 family amino/carboxypeptidase|nr:M20/M25/M40 family metallo-hydrolase [Pirellulaceae bacterium]